MRAERDAHGCVPWCPVRLLDEQTAGTRAQKPAGTGMGGWRHDGYVGGSTAADWRSTRYADGGSASRFFPVFYPDAPDEGAGPRMAGQGPLRAQVRLGDARDVLATLPDASVDAIVTDPPYALTDKRGGSKGFMGAAWDHGHVAHDPAFWAEVLRVAKPGAHLVAFGGTRTAHRLACAIEDAGWEIRDSLYLLWCHGQGFPKSLDVSKAIDKAAGAEREAVGPNPYAGRNPRADHARQGTVFADDAYTRPVDPPLTAPATNAAQQWDGWGTALKPSAEPIVLARKPLAEPTVAANVLAHGTGALHIDACRVATGGAESKARRCKLPQGHAKFSGVYSPMEGVGDGWDGAQGRWPPNTLLSHHPDCQPAGVRRVKNPDARPNPARQSGAFFGATAPTVVGPRGYADADGYEQVDAWTCHPQCPIRLLDEQAGPRTSGGYPPEGGQRSHVATYGTPNERGAQRLGASTGSASRFFPTFGPDPEDAVPFRYQPKASRSERSAGLDDIAPTRSDYRPNDPDENSIRTRLHGSRAARNPHPCVKPLNLMTWLVTLVTVPGGVVLDPFCGSGSTGVACVREGFGFIGIEMSPEYVDIARARIAREQEQRSGPLFAGVGTSMTAAR